MDGECGVIVMEEMVERRRGETWQGVAMGGSNWSMGDFESGWRARGLDVGIGGLPVGSAARKGGFETLRCNWGGWNGGRCGEEGCKVKKKFECGGVLAYNERS